MTTTFLTAIIALGLIEVGALTWMSCRLAPWGRRVLIPSLRDAATVPIHEHFRRGQEALQELRSINLGRSRFLASSDHWTPSRFWSWFLNLQEDTQQTLTLTLLVTLTTAGGLVGFGVTGAVIALAGSIVSILFVTVLLPFIAFREREERTRKNKLEQKRRREQLNKRRQEHDGSSES